MRVVVGGAGGVVGRALVPVLEGAGHEVLRLVRRPVAGAGEVSWSPELGAAGAERLAADLVGVTGAINLAGAGIAAKRWSPAYKRTILTSRVDATAALVGALTRLDPLPTALVSGSAYGYYGDTGDTPTDESGPRGDTFLARVSEAWERATGPAADAGIRVTLARTGLVVSPEGGAVGKILPMFKMGLGGRIGTGKQWWPCVSLRDEVAALVWLLTTPAAQGPYNLTLPEACTNADLTLALGALLHRPTLATIPGFALRAVLGDFADEILGSARVLPTRLENEGFAFRDRTITDALAAIL